MKTTVKIIAFLMAAMLVCFALSACGEEDEGSTVATSFHSGQEYSDVDFTDVAVEVKYDDAKTLSKVMEDMSKGKYDDKVIQIEGTSIRYGNNAGIVQDNGDGSQTGAMYYIINGTFPLDYPDDDAHVKLKGVVVVDETTGARHLEVPKEEIEIL